MDLQNQSPALGIVASLFLLAAQITVSAVGGCCGCCSPSGRTIPSETNRIVGVVCAVVSWILVVIAVSLFFRGASLNSMGYYLSGLYAGGGVLALIATALAITSFIMLRNNKPAANVEVVTVSASNTPNTHQSPMAFLQVGQPHLRPPHEAASAPKMPDVQPVPAFVMGHPMSSPGAVASAANDQDYLKQPPLPLPHTAGITSQLQVPHPQNQSPALGIVACIFLLAGQITVSAVGGCCGCCKSRAIPSETNRIVGVICAVVSWILAVIAMALLFRAAWLNSIGYYLSGLYAGGGVLALLATALGIASFIMLRSQSAADVEVAAVSVSASNRPSTQQSPMAFLQVGQPQFSPVGAASAPAMPDVQPVPGGVAMGHPMMSSPGAVAVATNNQEFKQQPLPEVVPFGHHPQSQSQSQPVVAAEAQGTVIMPREQSPVHIAGTTSLPQQVLQPQAYVMQQQPPYAVQPQEPLAPLPQGTKF
ncbi:hypothetical protein PR202_gb01337 [Eleusine coracana subsp. coracana]|uniref:Transmembrane protein n=1 Tax=Eleusine coracana subsp. coracana TaxID=191504 RepID=A0AAV5DUW3_ELECO|nr:hypothetical protein PR202_gb01337 [Eleusine coracana subsp. coracana]